MLKKNIERVSIDRLLKVFLHYFCIFLLLLDAKKIIIVND